jgi:hypothetical protein
MERENIYLLMETDLKDNSKIIKNMESEKLYINKKDNIMV